MTTDEKSIFDEANEGFKKDESLPLDSILSEIKSNAKENEGVYVAKKQTETTPVETEKVSALDKAIANKSNNHGMSISEKELADGKEVTEKVPMLYNDDRLQAIEQSLDEHEQLIEKRKKVVAIQQPKTQEDYVRMVDEISSLRQKADGTWYFDLHENINKPDSPLVTPKFVRLRRPDESDDVLFDASNLPTEDKEALKKLMREKKESIQESEAQTTHEEVKSEEKPSDTKSEEVKTQEAPKVDADKPKAEAEKEKPASQGSSVVGLDDDDDDDDEEEISDEKKKLVEVLIDKTGYGANFKFTEDETKTIEEASTIKINEVKTIDLSALRVKKSDKSFQERIQERNNSGSRTTIILPASGLKVQMKGMTYGEYTDLALSMDNIDFDKFYKRLSIIYNKMTNISTGPFKDFEDFLKNVAYTDISLATYALFVASEPEVKEIALECGDKACGKNFNWKYSPRSLLNLERCGDVLLRRMSKVTSSPAMDYDKLHEESAVSKSKLIELPQSHFVVEIGMTSAYEFLYNFVPLMDPDTVNEEFGELADAYRENFVLLTAIHSIYVPNDDGSYTRYDTYRDILDAIYNIAPVEIQILASYAAKITSEYRITFGINNVECPHCHHKTKFIDIDIDTLVFQTYQRLMNMDVKLDTMQDF